MTGRERCAATARRPGHSEPGCVCSVPAFREPWHLANPAQGLEGRAHRHPRAQTCGCAFRTAAALGLGQARRCRRRVPAGPVQGDIRSRCASPSLRERIGIAQRRLGAGLLDLRTGANGGRGARCRQPRLRAGGPAGPGDPRRRRGRRPDRHGRHDPLAGGAWDFLAHR